MRRLERSRLSDSDLHSILDFGTTRFGSRVGTEYFLSFDAAFERLRHNPFLGSSVDALVVGVRRRVHRRHRIFYRVTDEAVVILRVLHHAQDATNTLLF